MATRRESGRPALTGRQRRWLRGQAHERKALVHVGASGLSDAVVAATLAALADHELVKVRLHEAILLLVVMVALFRPDFVMDRFYPAFAPIDLPQFAEGQTTIDPGRKFRIHIVRETDYGERFKLFVLTAPQAPGKPAYGVELEKGDDGRYSVKDIGFNSAAEKAGIEFGDYVTEVDVEQPGRPAKQLVYPFALVLLGLIIAMQLVRRRRAIAAQTAAG